MILFSPKLILIISVIAILSWLVFFTETIKVDDPLWFSLLKLFAGFCISFSIGIAMGYSLVEIVKSK